MKKTGKVDSYNLRIDDHGILILDLHFQSGKNSMVSANIALSSIYEPNKNFAEEIVDFLQKKAKSDDLRDLIGRKVELTYDDSNWFLKSWKFCK